MFWVTADYDPVAVRRGRAHKASRALQTHPAACGRGGRRLGAPGSIRWSVVSLLSQAGIAVAVLAAVGAAVSLWWGAEPYTGPLRRAYRWFAIAAGLWGAGVVVGQSLAVPVGAAAVPLSFGDLPGLLALAVMGAGLVRLAAAGQQSAEPALPGHDGGQAAGQVADGYVVASALFLIGWVTLFGSAFLKAGTGPATFAAELVHPIADLALLGASLHLAVAAGRRGLLPYLAVLAITVSDALAVGARINGDHPGLGALLVQAAGLILLGLAPWAGSVRLASARLRGGARSVIAGGMPGRAGALLGDAGTPPGRGAAVPGIATMAAAAAAALAAIVIIGWALAGESADRPAVAAVAGTMVLALALRVLALVRRDNVATRIWRESGQQFRQLADRTSDVVLLCDLGGVIRYASRAVAGYGYTPESLQGTPLADLLHPEDRSGGTRAVRKAVTDADERVGRYPCRVRAADGTWRHVESSVSRYREPGGRQQLLVTARDVSTQVTLRRQVTHLTFHDGLTGLPNRIYLEQRTRETVGPDSPLAARQAAAEGAAVAGVILLDLDGFTAVNAAVGHSAGDLLLAQVGRRLRAAVPPQDTVARWGGDEFAVLIEGSVSAEEIVDIAQRLARGVASPAFRAGERDVSVTASVGVALAQGEPAGHMWRNADVAMARAKEQGGGRVEIFAGPGEPGGQAGPGGLAGPGTPDEPGIAAGPDGDGEGAAGPAPVPGRPQAAAR
jgi:diguanylate cyclase (GGDEF)-like protein/PAS domain S-box-containing protein